MAINAVQIEGGGGAQAQDVHDYRSAFTYSQSFDLSGASAHNGDPIDLGAPGVMSILLTSSSLSASASPTLDLKFQTRGDSSESWVDAVSYTQQTSAGSARKSFAVGRYVRPVITLGGTSPVAVGTLVGTFC